MYLRSTLVRCLYATELVRRLTQVRFFKLKSVPQLDNFEDGGLQDNNPVMTAISEFRILWPERGDHPNFTRSLGTGMEEDERERGRVSPVNDRLITRVERSFMQGAVGEKTWRMFFSTLPSHARYRYHRMNPELQHEAQIDNVRAIGAIEHMFEAWIKSP